MSNNNFLLVIWRRFKDLVIKLLSVKTIPALVLSVKFVQSGDDATGIMMLVAWALVVGFRYAEKVKGLFKNG